MNYSVSTTNGKVILHVGNTVFAVNEMLDISKEEFDKTYAPLGLEVNEAWPILQEEVKKLKDVRKPEKKGK